MTSLGERQVLVMRLDVLTVDSTYYSPGSWWTHYERFNPFTVMSFENNIQMCEILNH